MGGPFKLMNAYINNWVLSGFGFCKVILDIELHIIQSKKDFQKRCWGTYVFHSEYTKIFKYEA